MDQAAAQPERGCLEHIISLRLLTDKAGRKRLPIFVLFVDFTKVYDLVPRRVLLEVLKRLGCVWPGSAVCSGGDVLSHREYYWSAVVTATTGARQGFDILFFIYCICE